MKKKFYILSLLFVKIIVFADNVPAVGAEDDALNATTITFGNTIEQLLSENFLSKVTEALAQLSSSNLTTAAIGLFTGLFLIDFMYCIANSYLKGDYNGLVPTTVIKSFFFICMTTAFQIAPHSNGIPYFFAIPKEIVEYGIGIPKSTLDWSWFNPNTASTAITKVTQNGILTQVDKMISFVLKTLRSSPGFWTNAVFVVYFLFLIVSFLFIYLVALKLLIGLILKSFEWAIGLPIAFLMLAGKGHPKGEEYFNSGIQYIFYVALDFAVLMGMFAFGKDIFNNVLSELNNGSILITILVFYKLLFSLLFWSMTVLQTESIVAGVAGGAPQFSNRMGSALFSMGKMIANSTMIPGLFKSVKNATHERNIGGSFFKGLGEGLKDNFVGRIKTDEKTGMKYFESSGLLKQTKNINTTNLLKGSTYKEVETMGKDPITGKDIKVKTYKSFKADNELASHTRDLYNWAYKRAIDKKENKNFEKKYGLTQKNLIQKGLLNKASRKAYMEHKDEFDKIEEDLAKYGENIAKIHKKTGISQITNIEKSNEALKKVREIAENQFDSTHQRAFAKNSLMTKNYTQNLNKLTNSPEAQVGILKDWLKNSTEPQKLTEFSYNDFKNSSQNLGKTIVSSKNTKLLKQYQNSMDKQITDLIKKADNNELFEHITDDVLREKANKSYKVRISQIQRQINNLKIV